MSDDAVIYDLDGTLVRLDVDWNRVADDVLDVYTEAGVTPPTEDLWELMTRASDFDLAAEVEAAIARHERAGARTSTRLPLADELENGTGPSGHAVPSSRVGVCSLNCEAACRIALETHGLDDQVSAVVGRDTISTHKPDPEPLLAVCRQLGVAPEDAVFVGDSPRDAEAARAAGIAYRSAEEGNLVEESDEDSTGR